MTSVLLLNPFDAFAGSQRVAAALADMLEARGVEVKMQLGFGRTGFISARPRTSTFLPIEHIGMRKFLYPLWLLAIMPRVLRVALEGGVVWANTVYGAPATLLALLFVPGRVVIHVHEIEFPTVFRWFLAFAVRRGATLVCVSKFQRIVLGLPALILPNGVGTALTPPPKRRCRFVFVGTTAPAKGFALFVSVARELAGSGLEPVAYLPNRKGADHSLLAESESVGVSLRFGVTDPVEMFADGFLSLLATDPSLSTETFSLICAESIWNLVPVASAGTLVAAEIAGNALAFDVPDRDPAAIAARVRALLADPMRFAALVDFCAVQRTEFSLDRFGDRAAAFVRAVASKGVLHV